MGNVAASIHLALQTALAPIALAVVDDSAKHAGHAGSRAQGESHFTVRIVSDKFAGLNRVARHRLVYDALRDQFAMGLHALAIDAKTPQEIL